VSAEIERIVQAALLLPTREQQWLLVRLGEALGGTSSNAVHELQSNYASPPVSTEETTREPMENLDRITQQPGLMGGKACIRGMRVTVGMLIGQLASGAGINDLLTDYPYLEREDIVQALRYAAWRAEEREIALHSA
jgi:uncharacterized protein (DUF433 family)